LPPPQISSFGQFPQTQLPPVQPFGQSPQIPQTAGKVNVFGTSTTPNTLLQQQVPQISTVKDFRGQSTNVLEVLNMSLPPQTPSVIASTTLKNMPSLEEVRSILQNIPVIKPVLPDASSVSGYSSPQGFSRAQGQV
jgi:hypothetical protein